MACPLFIPSLPLGEFTRISPPLGDLYDGRCASDPLATIDAGLLRGGCNFGYARERCERASASSSDAVKLLVKGEKNGGVEIAWAIERDHHPVSVGIMLVGPSWTGGDADTLTCQARACADSYLRKRR